MPRGPFLPGVVDPRLINAYRKARRFLKREYVTGISIGRPRSAGVVHERLAICVHVREKVPEHKLTKAQVFPREIDGVPLDVIVSQMHVQVAMNPIVPGAQIMQAGGLSGTVGLIVLAPDGVPCVLTAAHVLNAPGQQAFQPSPGVGSAIGMTRPPIYTQRVDAAIVPTSPRVGSNRPIGTNIDIGSIRYVAAGEDLTMVGAMSSAGGPRHAHSSVGEHWVTYQNGARVWMSGILLGPQQGRTQLLSQGGDSGAVWFNSNTGAAVGLHVAGGPDATDPSNWAFACHMPEVFQALGLRLP